MTVGVTWVTVTDTPAINIVALRGAPELGETTRVTVAEPAPEDAPETVIQPGRPETAQGQLVLVWMLTAKLPPEVETCGELGATE